MRGLTAAEAAELRACASPTIDAHPCGPRCAICDIIDALIGRGLVHVAASDGWAETYGATPLGMLALRVYERAGAR